MANDIKIQKLTDNRDFAEPWETYFIPGAHGPLMRLSDDLLRRLLKTIPLDLTVIDRDDRVIYWNRGEERMFKIPEATLGRNVRECHPEKSIPVIDRILNEMKRGARDSYRMWFDRRCDEGTRKVVIDYVALRDDNGEYLGCIEIDQDVEDFRRLEGEDRSLH